jgi:hypothetical protein
VCCQFVGKEGTPVFSFLRLKVQTDKVYRYFGVAESSV